MPNESPSGILNLNKPGGITSHDVVNRVRRLFNTKKVGHTGTLDPMATGVLLICLGPATRLIEYMVNCRKQYRAVLRLGQTTTTGDADGEIIATVDPAAISQTDVQQALPQFIGTIQQTPPAYSAIKQHGVPLYKLARQGKPLEIPPREVVIESITITAFTPPDVTIQVTCGAGTYIRSLAYDLGQVLGVGAHLIALTRTANNAWGIETAVTLPHLEQAAAAGTLASFLIPKEAGITHLPSLTLAPGQLQQVGMGQFLDLPDFAGTPVLAGYDPGHKLAAILIPHPSGLFKPVKVFQPV